MLCVLRISSVEMDEIKKNSTPVTTLIVVDYKYLLFLTKAPCMTIQYTLNIYAVLVRGS